MPDVRTLLKSLPAPSPDHVVKWIRNVSAQLTHYKMHGAEPYYLTPEEIRDKTKREAKIGKFFVGPDGLITVGDLVAFVMTKVDSDALQNDATEKANARLRSAVEGGDLKGMYDSASGKPVLTHATFRSTKSNAHPLNDTSGDAAEALHTKK